MAQVHTHLTLRTRKRINSSHDSDSSPSSSQVLQHVSLTCLICHLLVYRVLQATPLDVDSSEGPVLPTEDWVEEEVLRSSSGWIDVSKQCIVSYSSNAMVYSVTPPAFEPRLSGEIYCGPSLRRCFTESKAYSVSFTDRRGYCCSREVSILLTHIQCCTTNPATLSLGGFHVESSPRYHVERPTRDILTPTSFTSIIPSRPIYSFPHRLPATRLPRFCSLPCHPTSRGRLSSSGDPSQSCRNPRRRGHSPLAGSGSLDRV